MYPYLNYLLLYEYSGMEHYLYRQFVLGRLSNDRGTFLASLRLFKR
jgi:hypothetical protein